MSTTPNIVLTRAEHAPHPNRLDGHPACHDVDDPEIFFPLGGVGADHARRVCRTCPLQEACLEHALAYDLHGVWGGTTRVERAQLRRERGLRPRPLLYHRDEAPPARPKRAPRRPEVAMPPPAYTPGPVEVRHVEPTAPPPAKPVPRFEYDPRRPVLILNRPAGKPAEPPAAAPPPVETKPAEPVEPEKPVEPVKHCPRCRTDRTLSDYYPNRQNPDGLAVWCKPCFRSLRGAP